VVGASGWDYLVPYQPDAEAAFRQLQEQVLESGEFLWREEYYGPRPTTRWQLAAIKDRVEFWEEGTHSILDMDRIVPADDEDHDGTVRPLAPDEVQHYFGTDRPTEADFDRAYRYTPGTDILEWSRHSLFADLRRWSGRYTILYDGGQPQQIIFFGCSGD
jgi:hypothetical protein